MSTFIIAAPSVEPESARLSYPLPARISRPVTYEGDPDCADTYGILVLVQCSVDRDGFPWFHDAVVTEDVRADDGTIAYHSGETIRENSYTSHNVEELNGYFLRAQKAARLGSAYDPADERQEFPADDFDQRPALRRAA